MKYISTLLFAVIIVFSSNSFAAEPIEQDVLKSFKRHGHQRNRRYSR